MINFEKYISESLWANIAAKRARGEKPAKPGEKGYPKTLGVKEEIELQELSKETLGSYKHKAELSIPADDREYKNRSKGIDRAEKKLKEEIVSEGAVKDLMMDLRVMPAKEFEVKYRMTKAKARAEMRLSSVAEATGDKHFDSMMRTIKKGTAKQKTADRRAEKADSQQRARDAFGPSPAASLGIRKPSVKEDVEQIDELSKKTLGSYAKKAANSLDYSSYFAGHNAGRDTPIRGLTDYFRSKKRRKGIDQAVDRLTKESVEQLDELSPNLLHRYVKKAAGNMGMHAVDHGKYGDQQKDKKSINKAVKRLDGITNASARMADKANRYDESEINDLAAEYINENNITLEELENMTEEELNELIGAAVGGAFKLAAKAAVGAGRLAGRAVNRMSTSGRADAAEKKASTLEKKNADRERIRAAQDRLRKAKEAANR